MLELIHFNILSVLLFSVGLYGVLARKSAILIIMAIELMLNAVNINFIAAAAFLVAFRIVPEIKQYAIFTHKSDEKGHGKILKYMQVEPLISLGMRLGEGTGAAVALPILKSAVSFLNQMASFESAGVSSSTDVKKS